MQAASSSVRVGEVELSTRESEIFRMLHTGRSTSEISELLSLSPITVRRHISAGVAKLGVADRKAAIQTLAAREPAAA
jgi:LuxR family transcriptional regulator of spore coat protein